MKRAAYIIFIILINLTFFAAAYCQQGKQTKIVRGQISDINWAGSSITVRYLQTDGYVGYDEICLYVSDEARITRGTSSLGLTFLQVGDQVTVEYADTSPGPLKIISMTVVVP